MLHVVPLSLAHRAWVRQQSAALALGRSHHGVVAGITELPGVVAIRDGRPVGYCLYRIERSGWQFTSQERIECRAVTPGHPVWAASPGASRYQIECCLLGMWPRPHPVLLQGLRTAAEQRRAYRIYALVPETQAGDLVWLGFRRVGLYPEDGLVELEVQPA